MSLVPHKITALQGVFADAQTSGKNTVSGAVVIMYDDDSTAITMYDDAVFSNGATSKTTDTSGELIIWITPGKYTQSLNGSTPQAVTVGSSSPTEVDTVANIELLKPEQTGQSFICQDLINNKYILQAEGYTALTGDITCSNGRVMKLQNISAERVETTGGASVQAEIIDLNTDIANLSAAQVGGLISFTTLAILQAFTPSAAQELFSYKVTNDSTPANNGYYHYISAGNYGKDADLVGQFVTEAGTDAISSATIENYTSVRTDIAYSNIISNVTLTPDLCLKSDGTTLAFPGGAYSAPIYIYGNSTRTIIYKGKYGGTAVGLLFRDNTGAIVSFTNQGSNTLTNEEVAIPSNAYTVELSTTKSAGFSVFYNEKNIPSVAEDLTLAIKQVSDGIITLPATVQNDVFVNDANELVAITNGRAYEAQSVVPGATIRYETKYGSDAVAMIFLDVVGAVISSIGDASNTFKQGFAVVPSNATQVRFSTTDSRTDPHFCYVNLDKRSGKLSGLSLDAIGDSITQGSQIKVEESISLDEAKQLVYCGLIGSKHGMAVTNNGKAGTRVASYNPYGRTVSYLDGGSVIGYDEIHYLSANGGADGKIFTTPANCDSIRLTIQFTDSVDANNSIADLSASLVAVLGTDLSGTNLYNNANNVTGSYIKYDGTLKADATGIYVDIAVSESTEYAISDLYEFATVGPFRYLSFVERIADFTATSTDIKTIMGGTNDRQDYIIGADDSVSPYEFKGALNLIIKAILDDDPTVKLGLITLLRISADSYVDELAQATIDIGSRWSVPVLDMRKDSGLNVLNVDDSTILSYDTVHPNIAGNVKIASVIAGFIESL